MAKEAPKGVVKGGKTAEGKPAVSKKKVNDVKKGAGKATRGRGRGQGRGVASGKSGDSKTEPPKPEDLDAEIMAYRAQTETGLNALLDLYKADGRLAVEEVAVEEVDGSEVV